MGLGAPGQPAPATVTFKTIFTLDGQDGSQPEAGLTQGLNGNLYGTTYAGGRCNQGTAIEVPPQGGILTYSLCPPVDGVEQFGYSPFAGMVQATNGAIYGTNRSGGDNVPCGSLTGCGTVFAINARGLLAAVYSFCTQGVYPDCPDGAYPMAGLIQASDGNLYGTTSFGGVGLYAPGGTIFKLTPTGTLTTLYSFCNQTTSCFDGQEPVAGLIQSTEGDLYGTTREGGTNEQGTVFKITLDGALTTLYSFCSAGNGNFCPDGNFPAAGLVQASNGNFYGTTPSGGTNSGGVIFEVSKTGKFSTLYSFCTQASCGDGDGPLAGLIQATDGDLYGTTGGGGAYGDGTIFKITMTGKLTTLHSFCAQANCTDGATPVGGVVLDTNGVFYGTTSTGGAIGKATNDGTVFSLSVGLGPFVKPLTTSGKVDEAVEILGTNLDGASSVTFNGTAAAFTVNSTGTYISTTVPSGATTGTVLVTTPSGTLSSNVPFRVLQ